MRYFLIILSIFIFVAISYMIIPPIAYSQTGYFQSQEGPSEQSFRGGVPTNKTWLILIGTLAGFALMFLLILEIGGGGLLPYKIEDLIAKICIGIIAIALCLYAYYMTQNILFLVLIPFVAGGVMFAYFRKIFNKAYMKKFGKPSEPNLWICRKCGAENSIIINECHNCNSPRVEQQNMPVGHEWICENCKNMNKSDAKSCSVCGVRRRE
jgi:ribosomal protein L40E